jgi:hypothetical protein
VKASRQRMVGTKAKAKHQRKGSQLLVSGFVCMCVSADKTGGRRDVWMGVSLCVCGGTLEHDILILALHHRLNMEIDLQSLFGLNVTWG